MKKVRCVRNDSDELEFMQKRVKDILYSEVSVGKATYIILDKGVMKEYIFEKGEKVGVLDVNYDRLEYFIEDGYSSELCIFRWMQLFLLIMLLGFTLYFSKYNVGIYESNYIGSFWVIFSLLSSIVLFSNIDIWFKEVCYNIYYIPSVILMGYLFILEGGSRLFSILLVSFGIILSALYVDTCFYIISIKREFKKVFYRD